MVGTGGWREGEEAQDCVRESPRACIRQYPSELDGERAGRRAGGERERNANRTMSVVFVEQGWRTREGEGGGEKCVRVRA